MTKVLIVEDNRWLAELQADILRGADYEVVISPNAIEAIDMIDSFKPDAIVLDVLLTGSTAFALLHEMQSHADIANIPVVLCTNTAESLDMDTVKYYGVKRVVDKTTMYPDDLIAAVRSAAG